MTTAAPPSIAGLRPTEAWREFPRYVGPDDNGQRMTPEEFDAIEDYDDSFSYELMDGVLIVNAAPDVYECDPNGELELLLRLDMREHPGVIDKTVYERDINTQRSRRRADRAIWIGLGRFPNLQRDVPTIAVEFLSAGKRSWQGDNVQKRAESLAAGVKEDWLFDRFQRQVSVFLRTPDGETATVIPAGGVYKTPLMPGFVLPVDALPKCADDWVGMEADEETP